MTFLQDFSHPISIKRAFFKKQNKNKHFRCSCICMILFLALLWDASLQMGLCVLLVPSLCEKTAVGAHGCPGWPLRHGDADARGVKVYSCWEVTPVWPAPENIYLHHLFLTCWLYTAGNLSLWMGKVLNYWSAVKQKVWEPEIKTLTLSHWNNLWLWCHFRQETSKVFAFVPYWFLILLPGSS